MFTYYSNRLAETPATNHYNRNSLTNSPPDTEIKTNDAIMKEYFEAMQTEINPSINYVKTNRNTLDRLLDFHNDKPLTEITREDIISYLNSH